MKSSSLSVSFPMDPLCSSIKKSMSDNSLESQNIIIKYIKDRSRKSQKLNKY